MMVSQIWNCLQFNIKIARCTKIKMHDIVPAWPKQVNVSFFFVYILLTLSHILTHFCLSTINIANPLTKISDQSWTPMHYVQMFLRTSKHFTHLEIGKKRNFCQSSNGPSRILIIAIWYLQCIPRQSSSS